jgi:cytoskeletal protein CcmA (bactofilin family)
MSMSAGIGQSIRIKGEIVAREPFLISGHVDGTIDVDGHMLTIAEGATVAATVTADTVVIQGKVTGELSATTKIVVRETATIEGGLSAPSISIADGASVNGSVETTQPRKSARMDARQGRASATTPSSAGRSPMAGNL